MSMCSLRWHFTNKSVTGAPCSKLSKSYSLSHSWTLWWRVRWWISAVLRSRRNCSSDGAEQIWNWVIGSSFTSGSPGHHFDPVWNPSFCGFRKKCPKCKTYIWNGEMTKVTVRCLLLDWNPWMSVHAMNFYFYLWLLFIKNSLAWEYFTQVDIWSSLGL